MSLHDELWAWAKGLPEWQSDLLRRVLIGSAGPAHDEEVLAHLLAVCGGPPASIGCVRTSEADLPTTPAGAAVRLESLSALENVGALEKLQTLTFAKTGLTLVYGDNGSGKSSYSRVLKASCRSRGTTKVLPNAYETPAADAIPRATLKFEIGTVPAIHVWSENGMPHSALKRVSVFDSESARHYIGERGTVAYQPVELDLLTRLADEQIRLAKVLSGKAAALKASAPQFGELPKETAARALVDGITFKTTIGEIDAFTTLSAEGEARRLELVQRVAELERHDPLKIASARRAHAVRIRKAATWLDEMQAGVSAQAIQGWNDIQVQLKIAEDGIAAFASKSGSSTFLGIGSESGTAMWNAASSFALLHPQTKSDCPLCLQALSSSAVERFDGFKQFVTGALQASLGDLRVKHSEAKKRIEAAAVQNEAALDALATLLQDAPLLAESAATLRRFVTARAVTMLQAPSMPSSQGADFPPNPADAMRARANGLDAEALALEKGDVTASKHKLKLELAELNGRVALGLRRTDVETAIRLAKEVDLLRMVHGLLRTQQLTSKQTEWVDAAITGALRAAIVVELGELQLETVAIRLDSKGRKGETEIALGLENQKLGKPGQILSEGEQRAVALAFFLAELRVGSSDGPLVVDDPVSSLDHERREHVATRLVEAARTRQVVVFTHDIVFAMALKEGCEKCTVPVEERLIHRLDESVVGVIRDGLPWKAADLKKRRGVLAQRLQALTALETKDPDSYLFGVKLWFGLLRDCWEQSVEEKLFAGVVRRFGQGVQTQQLDRVRVSPEIIATVNEGMTTASAFVHDAAAAKNVVPPKAERLKEELKKFEAFLESFPKN